MKVKPSTYTQRDEYKRAMQNREWCIDVRHLYWMHDVLVRGGFVRTLEVGSFHGASASAFVEAINVGADFDSYFCDTVITDQLRDVLAECCRPRVHILHERSTIALTRGAFDFVFIDGDHSFNNVKEEVALLLKSKPRCIMAHDTNATAVASRNVKGPLT